ncbi:SDR family NAD(P)-dependent oxidoreductase, partial [Rubellimicrobium arenae]|uniref:SDR family NAD(P)-dependent oxidoreductase n=1 Tax=Rubellimicrobium arenae TaxID=2817372 RepID=UPI0034A55EB9
LTMDLGLAGKVAVVTGGSVGIGLGVARALAREGAEVLLAARDGARAGEAARAIAAEFGTRAEAEACDVATAEGCAALVEAVRARWGGCDILVNNAGTGSNETILEAPDAKWQAYWDLHVMAAVRLARGLVPLMAPRGGGAILNNASICATQPLWYEPIYNVTKAALLMLSKTMSTEFIPLNIRVNTVSPGL